MNETLKQESPETIAERILPCKYLTRLCDPQFEEPCYGCQHRPAVEDELRKAHHCKDCCCARSWRALGITDSKGASIPEHIESLRAEVANLTEAGLEFNEEFNRIVAERDKLRIEVAKLNNRQFDALKGALDHEDELQAAEAAAFVRGLEAAKDDPMECGHPAACRSYIQSGNEPPPENWLKPGVACRWADAAFVRGLERAKDKLQTGGFHGATKEYILMFRRHIQDEIDKAKAGKP